MGKPKAVLVAPRNVTREVDAKEAARLLQTGSWCRVSGTKPITKGAAWQRQFRAAREAEGKRELSLWIPTEVYAALASMRRPGESMADAMTRLVKRFQLIG